jgi:hypothetical protein
VLRDAIFTGMLMQEFVRWQVRDRIPDDWEEQDEHLEDLETATSEDVESVGISVGEDVEMQDDVG